MITGLQLPDGRLITSGVADQTAIQSFSLTRCVNAATQLEAGAVCAAMVQIRLWLYDDPALQAGQQITVFRDGEQVGVFYLEKPTRPTANTMELTAYDAVVKLDRDISAWLAAYKRWPCSLQELAREVCAQCGMELAEGDILNGEFSVEKFTGEGITGRQLMQWIAQIAGSFVRVNAEGKAEFAWYTPSNVAIAPENRKNQYISAKDGQVLWLLPEGSAYSDGAGHVTVDSGAVTAQAAEENLQIHLSGEKKAVFYYQDGLQFEDYITQPISRVVLQRDPEDAGVGYPEDGGNDNDYLIAANPLLSGEKAALLQVAGHLYQRLQPIRYTPCRITVEADTGLCAGQTVQVLRENGSFFTAYIMSQKRSGQRDLLECTGSYRRASATEVNNQSFRTLQGKVLHLRKDVDGLFVSNEDAKENLAQLKLDLNGLQATVQQQGEDGKRISRLEQSAQGLTVQISRLESGVSRVTTQTGYTFDENGLHIQKSGQEMDNALDHTGMYVRRGSQVLLQANHEGVEAADVTVRNYLIVGEHARLEDYDGGTACFWI